MHPKFRSAPVIYLVGFMGCGKSTVGRLLADRLGWMFVDLDQEIERRSGKTIDQIFQQHGEMRFRQMERETLLQQMGFARQGNARVLALGGGAFADPLNRQRMEGEGVSVWLKCPVDTLWQRVSGDTHRPLAQDRGEFDWLYQQRLTYYQGADFTIPGDTEGPEEVVGRILALPLFRD